MRDTLNDMDAAAYFIGDFCRRWGRLGGQSKEKWGTVRFYASFGYLSLHTLLYPGHHYCRFPTWLMKLDFNVIEPLLHTLKFNTLFVKWQQFIYNLAYQKALKKWPALETAILSGADRPEMIKGFTRRDGNKLHVINSDGMIICTQVSQ